MMVQENISLKGFNTFGIDVLAKYFATFNTVDEINELLEFKKLSTINYQPSPLILGGGSNILFTKNFDGLVLKNEIKGIEIVKDDYDYVYLKAGAGENWHQFVLHCINNNLAGVENLSLIPGNVGALAPGKYFSAVGRCHYRR